MVLRTNIVTKLALYIAIASLFVVQSSWAKVQPSPQQDVTLSQSVELPKGIKLLESVPFSAQKVMIPYQKYQLKNGLTLILSQDHSDPLVHVDVTYHVGSAREEFGKSGYAHFFEHMMFEGSEHVASQQHFKLITQAGGTVNGATGRDITHYYETLPANELEKALWLEADRMGFLVNAITEEKFENQRATVINERQQRYDNRPYGLVWEKMGEALYPQSHPYSWQTIGYIDDLNRAKIDDIKAFFTRWYGPNNAVLTIGGDFDIEQTLNWVVKYFATIPKSREITSPAKQPVSLMADRYITHQDNITHPMLLIAYPTTYLGDIREPSLSMLATILGQGKNSKLYQALVKTGKVLDAGAFHRCSELACTLYVYANLDSSKNEHLDTMRQDILKTFDDFKKEFVEQSRLDEIKGVAQANAIRSLESVADKVTQLANNQAYFNQPDRLQLELDAIRAVDKDDIQQVFNEFIYKKPSVILSVVPKGKSELAVAPPNFKPASRVIHKEINEPAKVWLNRSIHDKFARNLVPKASETVALKLPTLWRAKLTNGIKVLATTHHEAPTVTLNLYLPAGRLYDTVAKAGLAELTSELMNASSQRSSEEELHSQLDKLGSSVNFSVGKYTTVVSLSTLKEYLPQSLAILQERLFKPAFKPSEFKRLKTQTLESIKAAKNSPSWLASRAVKRVLFGKNNILAQPASGTLSSVERLTLADVKDFYNRYYQPQGAYITLVGDIEQTGLIGALDFLGAWQGNKKSSLPKIANFPRYKQQNIWLVDKPDAAQSVIHFVRRAVPFSPLGEYYQLQLANFSLGDNMNSRLMQNLREDKGYTYGIYSSIIANKSYGYIDIGTDVKGTVTLDAIQEIIEELNTFSLLGVTEFEVSFMKQSIGQKEALIYETPSQKAGLLSQIMFYGLEDNFIQSQKELAATINQSKLSQLAEKWFSAKDYQIIIVGDKERLAPKLKTLSMPVQNLTF